MVTARANSLSKGLTAAIGIRYVEIGKQEPCPIPEYIPRKARALLDQQVVSFQKALAAGVKMALGTDAGSFGHGQNAVELAYLVEAGMTPMQAIVAATSMGTQCMRLGSEVGVLCQGMLADLLVVDGDPLQDVSLLQDRSRLRLIMKDGTVVKNAL